LAKLGHWVWGVREGRVQVSAFESGAFGSVAESDRNLPDAEFVRRFIHPEDQQQALQAYGLLTDENQAFDIEYRLVLGDGEVRFVHEIGEPVFGQPGELVAQFGTVQDVTEKKATEIALRASEQRFVDFAELASDWVWETGPDLRFTYISDKLTQATGIPLEGYLGKTRWECSLPDAKPEKWRRHQADMEARRPFRDFVYRLRDAKGRIRHIRINGKPMFEPDGRFLGYRGTSLDVTAQIEAEHALRESEERFKDFAETASDYLWEMGPDLRFNFTQSRDGAFGIDATKLIGKTRWELAGAETAQDPHWRQHRADLEAHRPFRGFVFSYQNNGRTVHVRVNGKPIFDAKGGFRGYCGTASDITAEVEADRALRESEAALRKKDEHLREIQAQLLRVTTASTISGMSSAIVHELSQPLTAILNYAQAGRRLSTSGGEQTSDKLPEMLNRIIGQSDRAGNVMRGLRRLYENADMHFAEENLNEAIEEACNIALIGAKLQGVDVTLNLQGKVPLVPIDRIQIQQVVLNLIRNSLEAMAESTKRALTIAASRRQDVVEVSVSDTGPGLPKDVADRLFQPFVTSKPEGMGIGLSVCRRIIESHRGRLWAEANPDGGTIFRFTLPIRPAADETPPKPASTSASNAA
jgi:PAS domain S-box-containing protein